ncbi:delta-60 repeat domain-containing protein [Flavobacterium silvaticum]|uniref:Delta-60 repeat domain-containing protein n=1 Tax=Flavobacterium silvaticum TaxID=1852020 RepID=A0A972FP58_9FLAO|nr:delta-60 repeat domain-containing protein [Flavobacterium silvaticum]NMH28840.1 delta-60 repeat domain-containing protein [Flavobacterium silvaticum]
MKTRILFTILFAMVAFAGQSQVGPGEIDNTFNSSGIGAYGGNPSAVPLDATADGNVYKSKVYPATSVHKDKILIVGRFTSYNGVAREYIARLNADGTLDTTFSATTAFGSSQYIYCVEILANDKILIGGGFTVAASGITYKNMARLNSDGTLDTTFCSAAGTTRGTNGVVHAFCPLGTNASSGLYIGGDFSSYSGTACGRVIKLTSVGALASGFLTSSTNTPTGEVRTIVLQGTSPTSKVLVGGFFAGFNNGGTTVNQSRIIRLNTDGSLDTTFNSGGAGATGGSDGAVFQIAYVGSGSYSGIYVAGRFDLYNGVARKGFIKLNTSGALVTGFNGGAAGTGGTYTHVFCFTIQPDNKFILGGNFTQWNGTNIPKAIVRLNPDGSRDTTFLTGTGFSGGTSVYQGVAVIRDIQLQSDSKIIVGGDFTTYDGNPRRMIARIKTRECSLAAVYYEDTGWDGGVIPTDPTNENYYVSIVSGTCTIPSGTNVYACELDIKPGATLLVEHNASITVKGVLMNNGYFQIDDSGSLIQIKDDAVNADLGDGMFKVIRNTKPVRRYDFTYWASPVENQTLYNLSPNTLADKYYKFNTAGNNWVTIMNGAESMATGQGYIIRAPQSHSITAPSVYQATFIGRPNNGLLSTTVYKSGTNSWNLLGNPYPSSIDINSFLNDSNNSTKLGGTVYIWTHNTAINPQTGVYSYVSSDYLAYNKTAGTVTSPGGASFNGKLASGQSFFVEALANNVSVQFKNSMRSSTNNTQFFRTSAQNSPNASYDVEDTTKSRVWLNITNANGAFHQIAVGYLAGATNGFDRDYDGKVFSGSSLTLYSVGVNENYVIQGRALPFKDTDEVELGYTNPSQGTLTISLAQFDGLFTEQDVYIKDATTNMVHNLKNGDYQFTSAAGSFHKRLKIIFKVPSQQQYLGRQANLTASARENMVQLKAEEDALINKVEVYDVTGKLLFVSNEGLNSDSFETTSITRQNQLILVKAYMVDGKIQTKKIMF